jgi:hypothetical protein
MTPFKIYTNSQRTVRNENRQQSRGPDEERKDHPLAGHVDVVVVLTARNGVRPLRMAVGKASQIAGPAHNYLGEPTLAAILNSTLKFFLESNSIHIKVSRVPHSPS